MSGDFINAYTKLKSIAEKLNVSLFRLLIDDKYRNDELVQKEIEKAKMVLVGNEAFERINLRLRDSLIFDKCNSGTLKLEERGMDKKDIIDNFKDELLLVKNSISLSKNSKRIMTKKIKAQLKNFKSISISMLTRRKRFIELKNT